MHAHNLRTRSFAWGGRVWACTYIQVVPMLECWNDQSDLLIANDVIVHQTFRAMRC